MRPKRGGGRGAGWTGGPPGDTAARRLGPDSGESAARAVSRLRTRQSTAKAALKAYQRINGLEVTGRTDLAMATVLLDEPVAAVPATPRGRTGSGCRRTSR